MKPLLLPLLLAVTTFASFAAEPAPRVAAVTSVDTGRVIVKFKSDASTVRARALSASAASETAAQVLGERAGTLGSRVGLTLKAGHAVGERAQVVTAEGMTSAQLAARLAADSEVEYAEPDRRMTKLATTPNDTYFLSGPTGAGPDVGQWYLRAPVDRYPASINAVGAWDLSKGGAAGQGVIVAVLDTGIRSEHPDLTNKLVSGYDMVTDTSISNDGDGRDSDPRDPGDWVSANEARTGTFASCPQADSSWHGTQVAGIIGAETNNGLGVAGVGWNVRIQPVRVLGKCFGYESDIAAGIQWAAGVPVAGLPSNPTPAKVINLSLGGSGSCSATYQNAINAAVARGVTVVVAAGNSAGHAVGAPGNCSNVVTVAAVRHVGTKVGYSDVGTQVTLAAPGGNCVQPEGSGLCDYPIMTTVNAGTTTPGASTYSNGTTDPSVGTSFSAPQVSGVAALMLALQPSLTPSAVKSFLQQGARPFPTAGGSTGTVQCHAPVTGVDQLECYCTTSTCGAGMLDASASVTLVQQGVVATLALSATSTTPTVGTAVTLTASASASSDRLPLSVSWSITQGGGLASLSATSGTSVVLTPSAAGTVVVQATVTDVLGFTTTTSQTFTVAAATSGGSSGGSSGGTDSGSSSSGGGGGGGAMSLAWLALLAAATVALRRVRPAA